MDNTRRRGAKLKARAAGPATIITGTCGTIPTPSIPPYLALVRRTMSSAEGKNALGHPALKCKHPVPSDIEVSQDVVKEVGLLSIVDLAKE